MDTKKKWLTVIRVLASLVIWFGIYKGLVYLGDTYLFGSMPQIARQLLCATVIPYALAMPLAYLVLLGMPTSKSGTPLMKPSFANMGKIFLIQSGFSFLAQFPIAVLIKILNINTPATTAEDILAQPLFYGFLLLVFAPVMEEILFRKIFFDRLMVLGTKPAILLSALFFALPHIISQGPAQFFYTFVLGLSFGFVAARTKKIGSRFSFFVVSEYSSGNHRAAVRRLFRLFRFLRFFFPMAHTVKITFPDLQRARMLFIGCLSRAKEYLL